MDEVSELHEKDVQKSPQQCGCGIGEPAPGDSAGLSSGMLENDAAQLETINMRLSWMERRRLEQGLDVFSLTMPQYVTLRCILNNPGGCSMTDLAESSHQLSATMTGIIDRLAERGLVQRERDAHDRRALRVVMTPEGKSLMEEISAFKRARMVRLLATLTPEERRTMIEMSRRYLELVEESLKVDHSPHRAEEH